MEGKPARGGTVKRDWEIIRRVLIALEEKEDLSPINEESIPGFRPAEVAYNMGLMIEAGLVDGYQMPTCGMGYVPWGRSQDLGACQWPPELTPFWPALLTPQVAVNSGLF